MANNRLTEFEAEVLRRKIDAELAEKGFGQKDFKLSQADRLWLLGSDNTGDPASQARQPYKQVALVFRCVEKLIAEIVALQPVLSTADEKVIESGPVYDLLFNNPKKNWHEFVTEAVGHYALSRDVFFVFTDTDGLGKPKEITIVSGIQMHPITGNNQSSGELVEWEFRGSNGERERFLLDEVVQWKNFNPYDRFHGIGPATAAKLDIDYSYAAALYNASSLANGAEPGAILTTQGNPSPEQIESIRTSFNARHAGASRNKRTALLTGGLDIKTIAMKMADMQVAELTNLSDKKICVAFGVPPELVGLATEAQYAGGPAQQSFISGTAMPLANSLGITITTGILSRFTTSKYFGEDFPAKTISESLFYGGLRRSFATNKYFRTARRAAVSTQKKVFLWFDFSQNPIVQAYEREVAAKVLDFTKSGITLNNLIETHDLPYEQVPWGDEWWIGMGQVPARFALEAGVEGLTGPSLPEGEEPKAIEDFEIAKVNNCQKDDEAARLRLWRNWIASWLGIEREYTEAMRKYFLRQQRIVLDNLKKELATKASKDSAGQIVARIVFDLTEDNGKLKVINTVFFGKASELGIRQALTEILGLTGDKLTEATDAALRNPAIRRALLVQSSKINGINTVTQRRLSASLLEGLNSGEGLPDLTGRVRVILGSSRGRASAIARTQTSGAVSSGRHVGFQHAGIELKAWVTSEDEHVRPTHVTAGKEYAKGIPLDQAFWVGGGALLHPCDPGGSPANIINCRCVEVALKAPSKAYSITEWSLYKFYSYDDMKKDTNNGN